MPDVTKLYHRGNNDASEANTLTAVFQATLEVDTSKCITVGGTEWFLADFSGSSYPALDRLASISDSATEEIRIQKVETEQKTKGKVEHPKKAKKKKSDDDERECFGDVTVKVRLRIDSPRGRGNGEAQAGLIAARFGLEHNGEFERFDGGPVAPGSEHWRVQKTIQVGTVPCVGGELGRLEGVVKLNGGKGQPAAYFLRYKVRIAPCGGAGEMDIDVLEGRPPRGVDEGGRVRDTFREVRLRDRLPYPLKNPGENADLLRVGSTGQPVFLV